MTAASADGQSARQLKRELRAMRESRDLWRDRARIRLQQLREAVDAAADARQRADDLAAQVATVTRQRDNALAGLPSAIRGVPPSDFVRLVLNPARDAWPCDSVFNSQGYWSVTFDSSC